MTFIDISTTLKLLHCVRYLWLYSRTDQQCGDITGTAGYVHVQEMLALTDNNGVCVGWGDITKHVYKCYLNFLCKCLCEL